MLRVTVWDLGKLGDGGTGDTSGGIVDGIAQWGEVSMWVSSGAGDVGVATEGFPLTLLESGILEV